MRILNIWTPIAMLVFSGFLFIIYKIILLWINFTLINISDWFINIACTIALVGLGLIVLVVLSFLTLAAIEKK